MKREENHSRWRKTARMTSVIPTEIEKEICRNSRQKVRVVISEYSPSSAKMSKKNGAVDETIFKYEKKENSNKTGLISIMPGVKRNQYATDAAMMIIRKSAGTESAAKNNSDFFMWIFIKLVGAYKPDSVFRRGGTIIIYLDLLLLTDSSVFSD